MVQVGDTNTLALSNLNDEYLGKNIYELTLKVGGQKYIGATGSDVITVFNIPFPHKLLKVEVKHTNSSNVDSTDALTWELVREMVSGLNVSMVSYTASVSSDFIETFGEEFVYPAKSYQFKQNTTNTDRVYVIFTIQRFY
jgi:hypothetical protein